MPTYDSTGEFPGFIAAFIPKLSQDICIDLNRFILLIV